MKKGRKIIARILTVAVAISIIAPATANAAEKFDRPAPDLTGYSKENMYNITVLPENLQEITGWGGCTGQGISTGRAYDFTYRQASHSAVVNESGLTIFRIGMPSDKGVYSEDKVLDDVAMQRYINTAIKPLVEAGITEYMISSWNSPDWMRTRDSRKWNVLKDEHLDDTVEWIIKVFDYITSHGYPAPIVYSISNEPADPGTNMTAKQMQYITKQLRKALDENGYEDVRLAVPEGASIWQQFTALGKGFSLWEEDPEYADAVDIIMYHSYLQNWNNLEPIQQFVDCIAKYPDKEVWQTELSLLNGDRWYCDTQIMDATMKLLKTFVSDMAWVGCNTWLSWGTNESGNGILRQNGDVKSFSGWDANLGGILSWGDGGDTSVKSYRKTPYYEMLHKVWKNATVGSHVRRMSTDDPTVANTLDYQADLVAFDTDKGTVAIIINSNDYPKHYTLNNFKGNSAEISSIAEKAFYVTNTSYRNVDNGVIRNVTLPAMSVTAVVTKAEDDAAPYADVTLDPFIINKDGVYYSRNSEIDFSGNVDEDDAKIILNGEDVKIENREFSKKIDINENPEVSIYTIDKKGNKSEEQKFTFKHQPDFVGFKLDEYKTETNEDKIVLSGLVNAPSDVYANDTSVKSADGRFNLELALNQGDNVFEIYAEDENGNKSAVQEVKIYCDSVKPEITVTTTDFTSNNPQFMLCGKLSEGAELTVNGQKANVRDDFTFAHTVLLNEGENEINVSAKDNMGNVGENAVKVTFTKDAQTPHLVKGEAMVRHAKGYITLDGKLDESDWNMDIAAAKVTEGIQNNVVKFGLLWDSNNLYVGVKVIDDIFKIESKSPWSNDCVEIFLNASNEKKGAYVDGDKQLASAFVDNDMSTYYYNKQGIINSAWRTVDDGYTCEIAIPWSTVGKTPSDGLKIGFDIVVDDNDVGGDTRNTCIAWWGKSNNYADTTGFGTIILTDGEEVTYNDIPYNYFDRASDETKQEEDDGTPKETEMKLLVNGQKLTGDDPVMTSGGRIMIPIQRVADNIGATISWEIGRQLVFVLPNGSKSIFYDTQTNAQIDGKMVELDKAPSEMINDKVYVASDFLARLLNGSVEISGDNTRINIKGNY